MNDKWVKHFYDLATQLASISKDPSTKVGALIVDHERRIIGSGYNGFARGVGDDPTRYANKATKYKLVVHAEANAILNAVVPVKGMILVATKYPCSECAKLIIQSGIACVYSPPPSLDSPWAEDAEWSKLMFREAVVLHREIKQ